MLAVGLERVHAAYAAHYNMQRPHRARQLRPPRPGPPVPSRSTAGSDVDRSSAGSSTTMNPQPETPGEAPAPGVGTPTGRYVLTAYAYGGNLAATEVARHMRGKVSAHELYTARRNMMSSETSISLREAAFRGLC